MSCDAGKGSPESSSLTLWDSDSNPDGCAGVVYKWNGYVNRAPVYSLLAYIETNEKSLRNKYLAWIHELGNGEVKNRRVIDHLALEDGLSYWWMTLVAEKSPYKSPVMDAIRLLAVEEIIAKQHPKDFFLVSNNRKLHEALSGLCRNLGIAYEWVRPRGECPQRLTAREIYRALPHVLRGMITLGRHLVSRWPFRQADKSAWFEGDRAIFFCSYFEDAGQEGIDKGYFQTHFWGELPALLQRMGRKSNWLQLFVPSATTPTPGEVVRQVRQFNQQRNEREFHTFLDAYLSWRIVARVLGRWCWLCFTSWHLRGIKEKFRPAGSQISLWSMMKWDWKDSMCGATAVKNLLWIELFDAVMRDIPHQEKGIYLCENIPWERALIHAWRKHGHGKIIGAAVHAAVRFWDMRFFLDPRTIQSSDRYSMPQADVVALNGKAIINSYYDMGCPKEAVAECEALRYGNLDKLRAGYLARTTHENLTRVLVLGDYKPSDTIRALRLLEAANPYIAAPVSYTVKPHPSCKVVTEDYPSLHLKVVQESLGQILQNFDIVYSSNKTSAALDAYLVGLPVVVVLDETEPNFSPLRNQPGVRFVCTPEGVAEALQTVGQDTTGKVDGGDFFFLDHELPRWTRLLSN